MNPFLAKLLQEKWTPRVLAWLASLLTAAAVTWLASVPAVKGVLEVLTGQALTSELIYAWSASVLLMTGEWMKTKLRWKLGQVIIGGVWPDASARKRTFQRLLELRAMDAQVTTPPPVEELDPIDDFFARFVEHVPGGDLGKPLAR